MRKRDVEKGEHDREVLALRQGDDCGVVEIAQWLDDRVVAFLKHYYGMRVTQDYPDITDVFFHIIDGEYRIEFVCDRPLVAETDRETYDLFAATFAEHLTPETDREYVVDILWAYNELLKEEARSGSQERVDS